ncbi:hypothetical protein LXA43DRAFT_1080578 [Ganoderma leucocontextum]|nr:hypothetical protein LXA43DRAFT_1080578 [Ganoderma leucocontextum]
MQANAALTALAYLQLPTNATVRLSDLAQNYSEPRELPTAPVPFLQQMDHLTRLDVITCVGRHASLHFVAFGTYSRFWIHINVVGLRVRPYVRFLCGMLPKNNLQTLRFSMQDIDDFPVKGEAPEHDTSHTQSDSDPEVSSHGYSDSDSDRYSGSDSDDVDYSDHPFEAARRSLDTPHNHDSHCANSPIEISGNVPAPQLKVVGLEVKCASTASLESFVRMVEARKKSGHPLDTVLCSFEGVDRKDVDGMKEHVVDGVRDVSGRLWVPTIDEAWLMKNDYWRLYPELRDEHEDEDDYAVEWGFNLRKW